MRTLRRALPTVGLTLLVVGLPAHVAPGRPQASSAGQVRTGPAQKPGQPPPPSTGVILGQIVDVTSGKPIPSAIAVLSLTNPPRPPVTPGVPVSSADMAAFQAAAAPRRIMTDGSGTFVFLGLPKGTYRLSADAPGFLSGGFGQTRVNGPTRQLDVDQGEHRTGLTIKLWPYGSISGTVLDDSGDPAVGVSLRLLRVTATNGQRRLSPGQGTQTDDRGAYRFSMLSPGEYLVALPQTVTSVPSSTVDAYMTLNSKPNGAADMNRDLQASGAPVPYSSGIRLGDQQFLLSGGMNRALAPPTLAESGKTFAYQTLFYPSSPTSAEASIVSITSGQERSGIDLQLRMAQTVRVSGAVTGPDGPAPNMGVKLVPAGQDTLSVDNGFETATTVTDAFGAFTFPAVPTGSYTLRVLKVPRPVPQPPPPPLPPSGRGGAMVSPLPPPLPVDPVLWAESPVAVGDADISGLSVSLRTGARIAGRVVFEGTAPQPTADMLQRMSVSVSTADGRPNMVGGQGRVTTTGQFSTPGYPPGKYLISAGGNLPGWFFKSTTLGGRNLDDEPLDIQGSDVSGVTITFTDRLTQISGTVHDPGATRDMAAVAVFFPVDYAALLDRGTLGRRSRSVSVGGSGAFSISGLPPGDYLVVAVGPDAMTDVRDKALFDSLARAATRFSLSDGEKKTLDLTVSPIR